MAHNFHPHLASCQTRKNSWLHRQQNSGIAICSVHSTTLLFRRCNDVSNLHYRELRRIWTRLPTEKGNPILEAQELDPSVLLGKSDRTIWWLRQKDAEIAVERSLRLETERKLSEELDQRLAQQAQVYEEKLNEQAQQHQAMMEQQAQRIAKLEQLMNDGLSRQKAKTKPNSFLSEVNSLTPNGSQASKKAKGFGNLAMAKSGTSHQG